VDHPGDDFLAGAGLAGDEHRQVGVGEPGCDFEELDHAGRAEDRVFAAGDEGARPEGGDIILCLGISGPRYSGLDEIGETLHQRKFINLDYVANF
jgi:hypothetical protein